MPQVVVGLGEEREFFINEDNQMGIRQMDGNNITSEIFLGHANRRNFIKLVNDMTQLTNVMSEAEPNGKTNT